MPNRPSLQKVLEEFDKRFQPIGIDDDLILNDPNHLALKAFLTKAITEALESVVPKEHVDLEKYEDYWHSEQKIVVPSGRSIAQKIGCLHLLHKTKVLWMNLSRIPWFCLLA